MCGIAGIYKITNRINEEDKLLVKKMTNSLIHRGPDDEGYFFNSQAALGHRRLSIIDLTSAGHQPMRRDSLVITFNGEIYNYNEIRQDLIFKGYTFKTKTDTEVILAAYQEWGEKCLDHFNGMWAFVIFNTLNGELFCSRDRMGVKPFYYYRDRNKFIFASEIKAILEDPTFKREPNNKIIYDYLVYGFTDHTKDTFFKDINQVLPGTFIKIKGENIKHKRYWSIDPAKKANKTNSDLQSEFRNLFNNSVNLRLNADVPVGSCLSGGLDSSSIVMTINKILKEKKASNINRWQKTFSSIFKGNEFNKINELKYIKKVVAETKAKAFYIEPDYKKLWYEIKKIIRFQDEPFGSTSIFAQYEVFKLAKQKKVKVLLDGQGADELLAGYFGTSGIYFISLIKQLKLFQAMSEYISFNKKHPTSVARKKVLRNILFILSQKLPYKFYGLVLRKFYTKSYLNKKFLQENNNIYKLPNHFKRDIFKDFNLFLLTSISLPQLLHWEDRNSMSNSIESRVPFLDYRLIEFVFSLPSEMIIKNGVTKYILRESMKQLLPKAIYNRQDKIGFATPEEIWFKKYLSREIKKIVYSESFKKRPYFEWEKFVKYYEDFLSGKQSFDFAIWRCINLELWLREFIDVKK